MTKRFIGFAGGVLAICLTIGGCGGDSAVSPGAGLSGKIKASGSSFADTYYQEVISAFKGGASGITVNYHAVGSGTGRKEFGAGLTDIAGTDGLVADSDGVPADSYLYVPTAAAPIAVPYHLPGVDHLQLAPDTLAKIFQRDITNWNDPAIAADNPDIALPDLAITVVHRTDGSGTTGNFTRYLTAASPAWRLHSGDIVAWPGGAYGADRNSGVAKLIQQSEGAIGYLDLSDASARGQDFAALKNQDGQFVLPTLAGATAALAGATISEDLTFDPLNAAGADTYPITAPTYLLVRSSYPDVGKAALVKAFVTFLLTDGQDIAGEVAFAPLPGALRDQALAQLDKIQN